MLFLAALTSAFSILEVIVSFAIDTFDVDRRPATVAIAAVIFLVGVPTAMSLDYLTLYDAIANQILLIGGGLLLAIFGGWFFASEASDELRRACRAARRSRRCGSGCFGSPSSSSWRTSSTTASSPSPASLGM